MFQKLILHHYRNYASTTLNFHPELGVTYIVGDNAQGKTNILEAIYLLALGKSFRAPKKEDLVTWGAEYARVQGVFEDLGLNEDERGIVKKRYELEVFLGLPPQPRLVLKKNDIKVGAIDFIGNCQVVFFHPEDLNMLYLGPDLRRAYLDVMNIQLSKAYFLAFKRYKKVLEQRNALLRAVKEGRTSGEDLKIWDKLLIDEGVILYQQRAKTLDFINKHISTYYQKISEGSEEIVVRYVNSLGISADEILAQSYHLSSRYHETLEMAKTKDFQAEFTTVGPHRDDFEVYLNGRKIEKHASRGEYRSIMLALKLIELEFFKHNGVATPLLLLDDVFSELDEKRQKHLIAAMEGVQTIITTTKDHMNDELTAVGGETFEVRGGKVI